MKFALSLAALLAISAATARAADDPDAARQKKAATAPAKKAKPAPAPARAPTPAKVPPKVAPVAVAAPVASSCGGKTAKKDVRDAMKSDAIDAKVKDAAAAVKAACGCPVKFVIEGCTYPDGDSVIRMKDGIAAVTEAAQGYCSDAPSKSEWCNAVADAHISWVKAEPVPDPHRTGKSLMLNSNAFSYHDAEHIKKIVE